MARQDVRITRKGTSAILTLDGPPRNALDQGLRAALDLALNEVLDDPALTVLVIAGRSGWFASGLDAGDETPLSAQPSLTEICRRIERAPIPVVAALSGRVMGAGAALALACHYRVAEERTMLRFPEIASAVIPEGGATQRLPRLVGLETAGLMLMWGKALSAAEAEAAHLIEARVPAGQALEGALALAQERGVPRPISALPVPGSDRAEAQIAALRGQLRGTAGLEGARHSIWETLAASIGGFAQGLSLEMRLAQKAWTAPVAQGLRASARTAQGLSEGQGGTRVRVTRVAILGDSRLGRELALSALQAGLELCFWNALPQEADAAGLSMAHMLADREIAGTLSEAQVTQFSDRFASSTAPGDLATCQVVIEAVDAPTAQIQAQIDAARAHIPDAIALLTTAPFSQAQQLQGPGLIWCGAGEPLGTQALWEFRALSAEGSQKAQEAAQGAAVSLAQSARRLTLWAPPSTGPLAIRLAAALWQASDHMIAKGASPAEVDAALQSYGFATGPCAQQDLLGLEVARANWSEVSWPESHPNGLCAALLAAGLEGRETGQGYRAYDPKSGRVSRGTDEAAAVITAYRAAQGITPAKVSAREILVYCRTALQNAAAHLLAEPGVRHADVESAALHALGFPRARGGPLFALDQEGAGHVLARIWRFGAKDHQFWTPAPALERAVSQMQDLIRTDP